MLITELKDIVGPNGWITDARDLEAHVTEGRGLLRGKTDIVVLPSSTEEVAAVVRTCAAAGVSIVPQGGNTGLCGGAVPDDSGEQIILNLSRMNRIRAVNPLDFSIVVDAGCILANIQEAARDVQRIFPLSLGAEGSCQIGGNLSTNAGGINVIRYGTARNLVLGLEVVLANGSVLNGLRTLRKDTAGYDLKQLFIGSEGTLGIITGAALKLYPDPGETCTALLGLSAAGNAVQVLAALRESLSDSIEAFEIIGGSALELVVRHIPGAKLPFEQGFPWYVLIEVAIDGSGDDFELALGQCVENDLLLDAVIAKNETEAENFWRMRHSISEAEKHAGKMLKHDISLPIGSMEAFLLRSQAWLDESMPDAKLVAFGHVGDGNLHYNLHLPEHTAIGEEATTALYDLVAEFGGSFSAEHGVGVLKRKYMHQYRDEVDLELMRTLKKALDPANILNPGKVF